MHIRGIISEVVTTMKLNNYQSFEFESCRNGEIYLHFDNIRQAIYGFRLTSRHVFLEQMTKKYDKPFALLFCFAFCFSFDFAFLAFNPSLSLIPLPYFSGYKLEPK